MIELIVVLVIIIILAGMLLPAIGNVRRTANVARVTADIKNIEKAIADFKLKFGSEPPSSFFIGATLADYSTPARKNSLAIMRQLWPNYDPDSDGYPGSSGQLNVTAQLNGAECLAFFLGGPGLYAGPTGSAQDCLPLGFSSNPSKPFSTGGSRVGPFYEFDASRLVDTNGNGFYELVDPLPNQTTPYQYFSSYNGRGYTDISNDKITGTVSYTPEYAYFKKATSSGPTLYWNVKSFQLISPGFDGLFGTYSGFRDQKLYQNDDSAAVGEYEKDNITNFSNGMLIPR